MLLCFPARAYRVRFSPRAYGVRFPAFGGLKNCLIGRLNPKARAKSLDYRIAPFGLKERNYLDYKSV